jgi:hypothetical protein
MKDLKSVVEGKVPQKLSWLDSHIGSLEEGVRRIHKR